MSVQSSKTGGLSDGPPLRRDRDPDTARSLECEGQTGGVQSGTPSENATDGRRCDRASSGAAYSTTCKELIERADQDEGTPVERAVATCIISNINLANTATELVTEKGASTAEKFIPSEMIIDTENPGTSNNTPLPQRTKRAFKRRAILLSEESSDTDRVVKTKSRVLQRKSMLKLDDGKIIVSSDDEPNPFREIISMSEDSIATPRKIKTKVKKNTKSLTMDELHEGQSKMSTNALGSRAIEWIDEIDLARAKSKNLSGRTSGLMKNNLHQVKNTIETLIDRVSDMGDPLFLRQENKELKLIVNESKRDVEILKEQNNTITNQMNFILKENESLKKEIRELKNIMMNRNLESGQIENRILNAQPNVSTFRMDSDVENREKNYERYNKQINIQHDIIKNKPKIKSVESGDFMDPRTGRINPKMIARKHVDDVIEDTAKIDREIEKLYDLRSKINAKYLGSIDNSDFPIINPKRSEKRKLYSECETEEDGITPRNDKSTYTNTGLPIVNKTSRRRIRRAPKNSVVAIKLASDGNDGPTYADIIKTAKNHIKLTEYGGDNVRVRKAMNGAVMVEIPGSDGPEKADKLHEKLREVLKDKAQITRPIVQGEARISNFDDSLTAEEIAGTIATLVGARIVDFGISEPRKMRNGMYMSWVRGPLMYIDRLANRGKIRLGWSLARVDQSRANRIQCFKCWQFGHVAGVCCNPISRAGSCFRCGEAGHFARACRNKNKCIVCLEADREYNHTLGSYYCKAVNDPITNVNRRRDNERYVRTNLAEHNYAAK